MKQMRPLAQEEKRALSEKLAAMRAAVERKATTRRAMRAVVDARREDITRNDLPAVGAGRYAIVRVA
jgi:hypothetical protein